MLIFCLLFHFYIQALIHLEMFLPLPKQIDYLDSLVDKFILPSSDSINAASASEKEELSCIFLEVVIFFFCEMFIFLIWHGLWNLMKFLVAFSDIINCQMSLCCSRIFPSLKICPLSPAFEIWKVTILFKKMSWSSTWYYDGYHGEPLLCWVFASLSNVDN